MLIVGLLLPFVFAVVHSFLGDERARHLRYAIVSHVLLAVVLLYAVVPAMLSGSIFREDGPELQLWPGMYLSFDLYLDVRNAVVVGLAAMATPLVFIWTSVFVPEKPKAFFVSANITVLGVLGVFLADSLLVFYFFWELSLVGAFFWVGFGGRVLPVVKGALMRFFLFSLAGSMGMLVAIVLVLLKSPDARITGIADTIHSLGTADRRIAFWGFFISFAVKTPMFGFHGWMRDLYGAAHPTARAYLSALLSKLGAFGFLIILAPAFGPEVKSLWPGIGVLCGAGIVYGAVVSLRGRSFLDVLIYSSLAHLNLIVLGALLPSQGDTMAHAGVMLQILNHGLIMAAILSWEARAGVVNVPARGSAPRLAALLLFAVMASVSLPGLSSFAGEFMILLAVFRQLPVLSFVAAAGLLTGAVALVLAYHRGVLGTGRFAASSTDGLSGGIWTGSGSNASRDFKARDFKAAEVAGGIVFAVVWVVFGLFPSLIVGPIEAMLPLLRY